ncbi:MAG: cyclic nucleotide-binding domain-containing protein [Nitrospinae bacterium]|nr:cyclic nucleotide-binding domain-containing protein [Nitrospinota bacterium]
MGHKKAETSPFGGDALIPTLARIKEFKGFSKPQLARIARLEVHFWGPEEFVIREGVGDLDQMILLLAGKVHVRKRLMNDGKEFYEQMAEITGPSIIGENSFFTGLARSAGVYAKDKVPGIVLTRVDFMRLISLDKSSFLGLLRHMAGENLQRAERTLVLYMGTLQLILKEASMTNCGHYATLETLRRKLLDKSHDADRWQSLVRDVMLFIRELNQILEELYIFANLPEIKILNVDFKKFKTPKTHRFYGIFRELVEDLYQTQQLVPLSSVNFKDIILASVMTSMERGTHLLDYPRIISISTDVYTEFMKIHKELGFELLREARLNRPVQSGDDKSIINLLWASF